jgi:signal transduction histidine kinase
MSAAWLAPRAWPLTVKVPIVVACLMVALGAVASQLVLLRLERIQEAHLRALASAYLDGIAAAVTPHVLRQDVWETFDVLERSRARHRGLTVLDAVVTLPNDMVLAATDPHAFPTLQPLPPQFKVPADDDMLVVDLEPGRASIRRALEAGGGTIGAILARIDIGALLAERREVLLTLILLNGLVTLGLAVAGYLAVRRMLAPVALLTAHVESLRTAGPAALPGVAAHDPRTEFGRLFLRFNAMAAALAEREALAARLAEEERLAQLGRLASGMAHEVNNPLGGMQNAIATLRKHGSDPAVRASALDLLERGLIGIRNVVRASLVAYKDAPEPRRLAPADLDDLRYLIQHEIARRQLRVAWINRLPAELPVNGAILRQAVLNILLNACAASALRQEVRLEAWLQGDRLMVAVADQGPGLPAPFAELLQAPAGAPLPSDARGLGIWTSARLIAGEGGRFRVDYPAAGGTVIRIEVPLRDKLELGHVA